MPTQDFFTFADDAERDALAWKVYFTLPITSFEEDMQGMRNFVDLALSSQYTTAPAVILVSSITVLNNWKMTAAPAPEIPVHDPSSSFGTGYAESKWISERVLQNVTLERGAQTVVVRVGQIAGDKTGHWNEHEWFPLLVKSALFQKCLPAQNMKLVTLVPSYEAARAFVEMRRSLDPILHLVHPRPVPWDTILTPIAQELNVPLVPLTSWLSLLEDSVERGSTEGFQAMRQNRALRLLRLYKEHTERIKKTPESDAMGFVVLGTDKAMRVSESLASLPQIDGERATLWLAAWRKSGFMPPQRSTSWKGKL